MMLASSSDLSRKINASPALSDPLSTPGGENLHETEASEDNCVRDERFSAPELQKSADPVERQPGQHVLSGTVWVVPLSALTVY
jgi:hypothetical protein